MIVVEGPDGSGKSTLVRRLQRDLGLPVAPRVVGSDTLALVDLTRWTEENVNRGFVPMIFDRHRLISEPIYGPLLRGGRDRKFLNLAWMSDMTWRFYAANPIVIYCIPAVETVCRNIQNPATDNSAVRDRQLIEAIYAGYVTRATLDFSRGVGRLFNYESTLYSDVLRWIKFKLEEQDDRARRSTSDPFGTISAG